MVRVMVRVIVRYAHSTKHLGTKCLKAAARSRLSCWLSMVECLSAALQSTYSAYSRSLQPRQLNALDAVVVQDRLLISCQ